MDVALGDYESAKTQFESLASYTHDKIVYQKLIQFYDLRQEKPEIILRAAFNYYNIVKNFSDPFLTKIVHKHFKTINKNDPSFPLGFIVNIWKENFSDDIDFAVNIAKSYYAVGKFQECILFSNNHCISNKTLEDIIVLILNCHYQLKQYSEAANIIETYKYKFPGNRNFQRVRAQIIVAEGREEEIYKLYRDGNFNFNQFKYEDPELAEKLYKIGHTDTLSLALSKSSTLSPSKTFALIPGPLTPQELLSLPSYLPDKNNDEFSTKKS